MVVQYKGFVIGAITFFYHVVYIICIKLLIFFKCVALSLYLIVYLHVHYTLPINPLLCSLSGGDGFDPNDLTDDIWLIEPELKINK